MFALRRVAARALQYQPTRQLSTLRPVVRSSGILMKQPSLYCSFHQAQWRLAEISPAEEQKEIKEDNITTSEVADAAKDEGAAQNATTVVQQATEAVKDAFASAASTVRTSTKRFTQFPPPDAPTSIAEAAQSKILYIGNLFFEVTVEDLQAEFSQFGDVVNSRVVTDKQGLSKGFGYIEFATQDAAERAVQELDQKVFRGRRMAVQHHVRRERTLSQGFVRNNPPSKTLYVGNISYQMSDRDLHDLFRNFRNVFDVRVAIDRRSGQPRGYAHAEFTDMESAAVAKKALESKIVYGRELRVDFTSDHAGNKDEKAATNGEAAEKKEE